MTLVRFQWRRFTAAQWTSSNPTLLDGEPGKETDTGKWKLGDGVTAWTSLNYQSSNSNNGSTITASSQTGTTYTFALADAGTVIEGSNAAAQTFTVPPSSSVAWPTGTVIEIYQAGAGQITIAAGAGVTLQNPSSLAVRAQYGTVSLRYRGSNVWAVSGDLA